MSCRFLLDVDVAYVEEGLALGVLGVDARDEVVVWPRLFLLAV